MHKFNSKHITIYKQKGIILFILSGLILAIEDVFIKLIPQEISLFQISFFNNFFSLVPLGILILVKKDKINFLKKNIGLHFLRSILSLLTVLLFIGALRLISLAVTFTLSFFGPIFMVVISSIIKKQAINFYIYLALMISSLGVILILKPDFSSCHIGNILALLSGLSYALSLLLLEKLHHKDNEISIYLNYSLISIGLLGVFIPFYWHPIDLHTLLQFLIIGSLYGLGLYILINSLKLTPVCVLAPFDYVCLVWVILFDYIVFKTPLTISGLCGMLMIVIGGLVSLNADKENFKS